MVNREKEYIVKFRTKGTKVRGKQCEIAFSTMDNAEHFYEHLLDLKENYDIEISTRIVTDNRIIRITRKTV
ncbi:hypothetical protein Semix9P1_phi62 [Clostridioides phage phiSemix9P1]|uniref:hypothetical protein n=1 Tax=unclassified Clostridioides TaxID=2635829 RepID=UPI0009C38BC7|nr:hypothetical protein Semix9P1_phi62 [Clostridioides phage phiSemix9P1]MCC0646156.1 hypothetical protein [Clostridioides sp. ZZV14-6150]MCC0718335.1 hypothetical protein [Clostridioides sp. ZZV14-6105]MCC0723974.1 hypothetical protein [Clostridioides sp. ZZV14-6104]MCC0724822.1 hypothetical protein [Clostridioides sp. ZZV14-6045]MCC0732268.1 hypothetical protein [Clostridioides sp. ZZV14-6048]MCC0736405.1 hypothetical protein [Clostridioides sp. ZZV14-6009]MCC0740196.1 hypothetical protein